jgi:hypothetical protein
MNQRIDSSPRRRSWLSLLVSGPVLATLLTMGSAAEALARAVTYQLQIWGGVASGSLGGVAFTNASLVLTFDGDTSDVMAFSIPGAFGAQILKGAATVDLDEGSAAPRSATFLPSAGVYVSVDGQNSGIP